MILEKEIRNISFDDEGTLLEVGFKGGQIRLIHFSIEKKAINRRC